ncbi:hypothetical protein Vretimale_10162, partial [Volvox reticuliferus]
MLVSAFPVILFAVYSRWWFAEPLGLIVDSGNFVLNDLCASCRGVEERGEEGSFPKTFFPSPAPSSHKPSPAHPSAHLQLLYDLPRQHGPQQPVVLLLRYQQPQHQQRDESSADHHGGQAG